MVDSDAALSVTTTLPTSVNITTVQDFTWDRNCGGTAGTMLVDWYGRYKDPELLDARRPHSTALVSRLLSSTYFGFDGPTYQEWITEYEDYLQDYSTCSVTVSGVDHGDNTVTWNTYKNHVGSTLEPAIVRYDYNNDARHAMAGVGYTGSYYRVRDTYTEDGIMLDTYYYNQSLYEFSCILVHFGTSSWRTGSLKLNGSNNSTNVKRLETMLFDLYYDPGTIDTTFSSQTDAAVRAFQSDFGLTVDGSCGPNTYNALVAAHRFSLQSRVLKRGLKGDDVAELQRRLNRFRDYAPGYSSLPLLTIDGSFGPATETAVKKFQELSDLTIDGHVGPQTYSALLN